MADDLDEAEDSAVESVRVQLARLGEKIKRKVEDRELNTKVDMLHAADQRVFKDTLDVIERSTGSLREYVRDRVKESSLETANALSTMESHLKEHMTLTINAAVAATLASMSENRKGGGWHPMVPYGGGGAAIATVILILASMLGLKLPGFS